MMAMITRLSADTTCLDDKGFENLAAALARRTRLYTTTTSPEAAQSACADLRARGYTAFAERTADGELYRVRYSATPKQVRVADAGLFGLQQCNDGLYRAFEREAGVYDYDFDDGAVWRVEAGEDGEEYLVKTVEDDDDDRVVRCASAHGEALVTGENYVDALQLIYGDGVCAAFVNDVEHDGALRTALIASLNDKVEAKVRAAVRMYGERGEKADMSGLAKAVRAARPVTASQLAECVGRYMLENGTEG
jgi:hypothetical protein